MNAGQIIRSGIYRYEEIGWLRREVWPVMYSDRGVLYGRKLDRAAVVQADAGAYISLATNAGTGKITDAGYDQMVCQYFRLPTDRDLRFTAVLRMSRFPEIGECTRQEGGGLFFRDTMELDRGTGYPYSNLFLAGACLGGWNGFLRTGVADGIESVKNESHLFASVPTDPSSGTEVEICLEKIGETVLAGIRPAERAAREEQWKGGELWEMPVGADTFFKRDRRWMYAGFLAAADCGTEIRKDTVRVEIRLRKSAWQKPGKKSAKSPERLPVPVFPAEASAEAVLSAEPMKDIFASPEGTPDGLGTLAEPWDLQTAVERCQPGQTIRLRPGRYRPEGDVALQGGGGKRLVCDPDDEEYAVLDFRGRLHGLLVDGNDWEIRGIAAARGLGIQIRGKRNRLSRCAAAFNLETGILIRAARNDAPRSEWPAGNIVCDCVSIGNMDPSEHNADGFACKVAAGEGNSFLRCRALLNTDDGFDLFSKNLPLGPVHIENCISVLNGYCLDSGTIRETKGNGNGFKLGGSGQLVRHTVRLCEAYANRKCGFTTNTNPWFALAQCRAGNNKAGNYQYYFTAPAAKAQKDLRDCTESDDETADLQQILSEAANREKIWEVMQEVIG